MPYDFETLIDRSGSGAIKWDKMRECDPAVPAGIVPFSIGDMDLKTPPELAAGLKSFLDESVLGYTAPTPEYRRAVCDWFRSRHAWEVEPDWLVGFDGVVPALYAAVRAFTEPGDGVVYMPPVYYPIFSAIEATGRRPAAVPLLLDADGYGMDFERLEEVAADPQTKLLIFCSPHNPVSRVWRREELARLGRICLDHGVLVVSDEIHMDFVMPGYRHLVYADIDPTFAERCLVCTAPSKTFNIAGLQVSNIVVPNPSLRRRLSAELAAGGRHGPNQLGLAACRIAYERCAGWLDALLEHLHHNSQVVKAFMQVHFPEVRVFDHQGTYFVWLDFRAWGLPHRQLEEFMVRKARLFLDEGYVFGSEGEGFERINIACPTRVLEEGLERLRKARL